MMNEQKKQAFLGSVQTELLRELEKDVATTRLGKGETLEERGSEVLEKLLQKSYIVDEYLRGDDKVADSTEEATALVKKGEMIRKVIELMDIQSGHTIGALRDREARVAAGIQSLEHAVNSSQQISYQNLNRLLSESQGQGTRGENIEAKFDLLNRAAQGIQAQQNEEKSQEDEQNMENEKQAREQAEQLSEERSRRLAQERQKAQKIALTGTIKPKKSNLIRNGAIAYAVAGAAVSGITLTTLFFA